MLKIACHPKDPKNVDQCLSEISLIGCEGVEFSTSLPGAPRRLTDLLRRRRLQLAGGRHETHILTTPWAEEKERLHHTLDALAAMGTSLVIFEETGLLQMHGRRPLLSLLQRESLELGLDRLAKEAEGRGFQTAYHPQVGSVVQTEDEIDPLMDHTETLGLLYDTGHLELAGAPLEKIASRHAKRICHVYCRSVTGETFTVPGKEGLNFVPLVKQLIHQGYDGWLVMDDAKSEEVDSFTLSQLGFAALHYARLSGEIEKQ